MPTALNFSTLQADMKAYLQRGGPLSPTTEEQLPRLINLAERGIARDIKIQGFIVPVTTVLPANISTLTKPDGWRETVSMFYGVVGSQARNPLFPRSYEYCRAYWPDPTLTDVPLFYADYDYAHWLFAPTPTVQYNLEILYYTLPPLLDSVNTTNWLSDFAPELLEYRAFWEMALFIRAQDDAAAWEAKYNTALSAINQEDLQKIIDRSSTRQEA
jgi:hypothetical protein